MAQFAGPTIIIFLFLPQFFTSNSLSADVLTAGWTLVYVKTCSAHTSHFPLQPSTQASVSQRTLTITITAVALRACVATEDSIFHTFKNKSCKNLLERHTKNLSVFLNGFLLLFGLNKTVVCQYGYCFLPQIHTHQGWTVCILYFLFVFPLMGLFCSAYVHAKKRSYSA